MGRACSGLESKGSFGHRKDAPPPQRKETQEKNPRTPESRGTTNWPRAQVGELSVMLSRGPFSCPESRVESAPNHTRDHPRLEFGLKGPKEGFGGPEWGLLLGCMLFALRVCVRCGGFFWDASSLAACFFLGSCWVPLVFLCLVMFLGPQRDAVGSRCGPFRLAPTGESRASVPGQTFQPRRTPTTLFAKCVP